MTRAFPILLVTALLAAAGCGDDDPEPSQAASLTPDGGPRQGQPQARPDAARPELSDVEVWMPPDAGHKDNPDPTAAPDAGPDGRVCAPLIVDLSTGSEPACTAETGDCVVACASEPDDAQEGCRDACAAQDTFGGDIECSGCITLRLLGCFDARGCSNKALFCCLEDKCGIGGPDGCVDAMCQPELQALFTCVTGNSAALSCFDFAAGPASSCFAAPSMPVDAGT